MKPVVAAILTHPALYLGPRMVKPPIVLTAGLLRRLNAGVTTTAWAWIGQLSGQQLFYPPNVAGWDDTRWLDTATFRGRFIGVQQILGTRSVSSTRASAKEAATAEQVYARALTFWNNPTLSAGTEYALMAFAKPAIADAGNADWKQKQYPVMVEHALRQLIAVSPDLQTA